MQYMLIFIIYDFYQVYHTLHNTVLIYCILYTRTKISGWCVSNHLIITLTALLVIMMLYY